MESLREWLSQWVCYLCLMTLLLHVIPDNGLKRYVRFFLGLLLILVVMEPLGNWLGNDGFFVDLERESLKGLYQIYESGKAGLADAISEGEEERYQEQLREKIEKIYETYHIPSQEIHNNNQETGAGNGETGFRE